MPRTPLQWLHVGALAALFGGLIWFAGVAFSDAPKEPFDPLACQKCWAFSVADDQGE